MLEDQFERRFPYIRLSLTDACNFRCQYCLPSGYKGCGQRPDYLSPDEIACLVRALTGLGVRKIRLTGGEPSLRSDLIPIIELIASFPGIQDIGLSTNGFSLHKKAADYVMAGVTLLNVSLDTLDPELFKKISGKASLSRLLAGLERAVTLPFRAVKINTVLMKDYNYNETEKFLGLLKRLPLTIRFIELMPTGRNSEFFRRQHVRAAFLREAMERDGWLPVDRTALAGPAREFRHPDFIGKIGFIEPYRQDFCGSCNRLRITCRGEIRLCLFSEQNVSLRHLLKNEDQTGELTQYLLRILRDKKASHQLSVGHYGSAEHFAAIGG